MYALPTIQSPFFSFQEIRTPVAPQRYPGLVITLGQVPAIYLLLPEPSSIWLQWSSSQKPPTSESVVHLFCRIPDDQTLHSSEKFLNTLKSGKLFLQNWKPWLHYLPISQCKYWRHSWFLSWFPMWYHGTGNWKETHTSDSREICHIIVHLTTHFGWWTNTPHSGTHSGMVPMCV